MLFLDLELRAPETAPKRLRFSPAYGSSACCGKGSLGSVDGKEVMVLMTMISVCNLEDHKRIVQEYSM